MFDPAVCMEIKNETRSERNERALQMSVTLLPSWRRASFESALRRSSQKYTSKQAAMAWAPKPDVDPYGTLRSLVCHVSRLLHCVPDG
jgi:hypothetical protein